MLSCNLVSAADYTNTYTVYENGNISPSYGQLVENTEAGTTLTITTAGSWYPWISSATGNGTGSSNGTTITTSTGNPSSITVGANGAGAYSVGYHVSFDAPGGALVEAALYKNGSRMVNTQTHAKMDTAGKTEMTLSAKSTTQAAIGDVFTLRLSSDSNADDITLFHVYMGILRFAPPLE